MLLMEMALKVRGRILRDGCGIRAVARETGLSRATIKKYLRDCEPPLWAIAARLTALPDNWSCRIGQGRLPGTGRRKLQDSLFLDMI